MLICSHSYLLVDHTVFLKYIGTVQERYHKEKRFFFFIQAPTVLNPGTWTNGRLIIRIRICQPPLQALRFPQVEPSDWWWTAARDHGKGTDGRGEARCLLPAFLCAHIFIEKATSGYEAADIRCICWWNDSFWTTRYRFVISTPKMFTLRYLYQTAFWKSFLTIRHPVLNLL